MLKNKLKMNERPKCVRPKTIITWQTTQVLDLMRIYIPYQKILRLKGNLNNWIKCFQFTGVRLTFLQADLQMANKHMQRCWTSQIIKKCK